MTRIRCLLLTTATIVAVTLAGPVSSSNAQVQNVIDFDIQNIIQCSDFTLGDPELPICEAFMPFVISDLLEAEAFIDQVFAGYRLDMPSFVRNQLADSITVFFQYEVEAVGGDFLARAFVYQEDPDNPLDDDFGVVSFIPNPFLQNFRGIRPWAMARAGVVSIDILDIPMMVMTDTLVETIVHEVFHAVGHPALFLTSGLNAPTNIFGMPNFVGDDGGINGAGYGLTEFRSESINPFADFIPLSQIDENPGAHLSSFDPTFNRPFEALQEVFVPVAAPIGFESYMSRSMRGMFADLGFLMRGVNMPGIVDIDLDGVDDVPLIVNPRLPTDPQP